MIPDHHNDNHTKLSPARVEAFSDGVMAIIITISVLELKVPTGVTVAVLRPLLPLFFTYAISFETIGTYWNNHHHLLQVTKHVSAGIMWANLHLLFWLSLIPFATGWLGENHGGHLPTVLYSAILFFCACAYSLLQWQVISHAENREELSIVFHKSKKGLISLLSYALAVVFGFFTPVVSYILIILVAILWFIPDRRIEKFL